MTEWKQIGYATCTIDFNCNAIKDIYSKITKRKLILEYYLKKFFHRRMHFFFKLIFKGLNFKFRLSDLNTKYKKIRCSKKCYKIKCTADRL